MFIRLYYNFSDQLFPDKAQLVIFEFSFTEILNMNRSKNYFRTNEINKKDQAESPFIMDHLWSFLPQRSAKRTQTTPSLILTL
jgi:hypothetical protein